MALFLFGNRFNFLIRTVAFFILQKIERNDFKCILPTHPNSGSLIEMRQKPNFDRRNDYCNENEIVHFSDNKKLKTDRKRRKEVDFMTIKIRSPTKTIT